MKRKFSVRKFALFLIVLSIIIAVICCIVFVVSYYKGIGKVSNDDELKEFTVENGETFLSLADDLKEKKLINSEFYYKIYIKLHSPNNLTAGIYELSENMGVQKIIDVLTDDEKVKQDVVKLTFREGLNVKQMSEIVAENTEFSSEEFINKVNDNTYLDSLIEKYWFLTDTIKNEQIIYSLEGYLYPNTYHFKKDEVTLDNIIEKLLDETGKVLDEYKGQIESSGYSVHEVLTLASLIELEAVTEEDRKGVSGVFHNRLNNNWSLGSDVTTYYSAGKSMTESLTSEELNACNGYNTRCTSMVGLPVGPINSPSASSIDAALNPTQSNFYFFVADVNKKVYFTTNMKEHNNIIAKLKKEGLWNA